MAFNILVKRLCLFINCTSKPAVSKAMTGRSYLVSLVSRLGYISPLLIFGSPACLSAAMTFGREGYHHHQLSSKINNNQRVWTAASQQHRMATPGILAYI